MGKRVIYTDSNKRELIRPLNGRFPVRIEHEDLSDFLRSRVPFHWHPEIEMAFVTDGSLLCQANGAAYRLTKGTGIFLNTNTLHGYMPEDDKGCLYKAILFNSALFGQPGSLIYEKYTAPLLSNPALAGIYMDGTKDWQKELIGEALSMTQKAKEKAPYLELSVLEGLTKIWRLLCENTIEASETAGGSPKDIARMKQAMIFVQEACGSPVSLADIAASCSLSQSECCRLFRRILRQSPMEYVISCRINKSLGLLAGDDLSMTEIAGLCGFQSSSYFSETFKKLIGMSPSEYKKELLSED